MTDWFRSWHGAPTDGKWRTIAKLAGVAPSLVVSLAWVLLDRASQADQRGSIDGIDIETVADFLGCEPEEIERVITAMTSENFFSEENFVNWDWLKTFSRPSGSVWASLRAAIFARDDYRCSYCGARGVRLECDHIVPVSRGGQHNEQNLTTSCFDCNRSKGTLLLSEWRKEL